MAVDGPLGEYNVRFFAGQHAAERFVMLLVHHGAPVILTRECSARLQNPARLFGFGGADFGTAAQACFSTISFAAVEI